MSAARATLVTLALVIAAVSVASARYVEGNKSASSMTYMLIHPLHKIEATSNDVYFKIDVDQATRKISYVYAKSDVTTFNSGNSSRDSHAMEVIDAMTYPDVEFTGTSIQQNGDQITVTGKLNFHGVTKEISVPGTTQWDNDKLVVTGHFEISLTAFSIERPSLLMVPTEDALKFDYTATFPLK